MNTWEDIRSNWVNGNLSDARKMMLSGSKKQIFSVIKEALDQDYFLRNNPAGTFSGDLVDLREILKSILERA